MPRLTVPVKQKAKLAPTATDLRTVDFYNRCERFAAARAGAQTFAAGPDKKFAARFIPTLGGERVRLKDTPADGYEHRDQAVMAARKFKMQCKDALLHGASRREILGEAI